jgi:hypothetical protein
MSRDFHRQLAVVLALSCALGCGEKMDIAQDWESQTWDGTTTSTSTVESDSGTDTSQDTVTGSETVTATSTDTAYGSVVGLVLLQGEVSHAGATVTLDGTNQSQTTSETGAYELLDVAPGTYTVTASLAGYETRTSAAFEVKAGEEATAPSLTLPQATADHGVATALVKVGGDNQTGINTTTLANPLEVEVRDQYGNPVDGVQVSFAVTTGAGTLDPSAPQTTNALGRASASLTLSSLGSLAVTASASGLSSVVFSATSLAGNPSRLVLVSGEGQEATVGTQLGSPLVVRVEDNYDNPVASATVHFVPKALSGIEGSVGAANVETNAQGQAQTTFTLGTLAGATAQWMEVTVNDFSSVATLSIPVLAEPDEPASIEIVSGNNQLAAYGQQLAEPFVVLVKDEYANPVWDESVSWSSTTGGAVAPNPATTGSDGRAAVTATLGSTPGMPAQDFKATAGMVNVTFTATATGPSIEWIEPGRTWPGCPVDLEVEILGGDFDSDAVVIWDAGGAEQSLVPSVVESDRIVVTFTSDLFDVSGEIPLAVQQTAGGRSATYDFVVGSVLPDTGQRLCYNNGGEMSCPSKGQYFWGQDAQFGWDLHITPAERFERTVPVANQPVVFDRLTQLEWQGCAAGQSGDACATGSAAVFEWQEALPYCAGLNWGGYDDWRLPDRNELQSIVHYDRHNPAIEPAAFPATPSNRHWSSSSYVADSGGAWYVSFDGGYVYYNGKPGTHHARCVRGRVGP